MHKAFIVFGPPACGKTRNAQALAAHFGVSKIVDDWDPRLHQLERGALHLTHSDHRALGAETHAFGVIRFNRRASADARRLQARSTKTFEARRK